MRETKSAPAITTAIDGNAVTGLASVFGNIDSGGDRMWPGAFAKTIREGRGRVKHLWQHDMYSPPIAVITNLREVGRADLPDEIRAEASGGLEVTREYLNTDRAQEVLEGIKAGAITEMSFAFDAIKWDVEEGDGFVRNLREVRLWETSDVIWGMNALTVASKSALPFVDTGVAPQGADYTAPELSDYTDQAWDDLNDSEKMRIAAHYAYSPDQPPNAFGDLKLPHHQPAKVGVGPAVWNGAKSAMGMLLDTESIPDASRRAVYDHLAKHYGQFEQEPPAYKWLVLVAEYRGALVAGGPQYLGAKDMSTLSEVMDKLTEHLRQAEPPRYNPALTRYVLQRLAQE